MPLNRAFVPVIPSICAFLEHSLPPRVGTLKRGFGNGGKVLQAQEFENEESGGSEEV